MIRTILILTGLSVLTACAGGSQYSSQRAQAPTYVPAAPNTTPVLTEPVAITPGATPILTESVAITPGAVPVTPVPGELVTASAPAASLKPPARAQVLRTAAAPAPAPIKVAAVTPKPKPRRAAVRSTKGPIYSACRNAGRKAATVSRCACVQAVADRELTKAQQRRGAGYFNNQQKLQDVRQSGSAANEEFWTAWKAYGTSAGRQCSSS